MQKNLIIPCIILLLFASCSKKAVVKPVENPGDLYVKGVDEMKKKKYDNALADFAKVRESFPFDPIAVVAQIKQADAYFEKKDYQMAGGSYEDFVNSYPDDENAAYALHRLGECYEKQSLTADRDQAITLKAIERFTFLKNRYPTSPYAKDADAHIAALTAKLAARELYVGEFYYKTGSYNASILRLDYFLTTYPGAKERDKALYYLVLDYRELHNPEKAQQYLAMLRKEYPKSNYSALAAREKPAALKQATAVQAAPPPIVVGMDDAPGDVTYSETKKREIDLKPTEPAPVAAVTPTPEKVAPEAPGDATYSETKKREIDLKPTEPVAVATVLADNKGSSPGPGKAEEGAGPQEAGPAKEAAAPTEGTKENAKKDGDRKASSKNDTFGLSNQKNPVDVIADTMEAFEKGKTNVFTGNVVVKQEGSGPGQTLYLFSDKVTAYRNEAENEIQRVDAEGHVRIVKADRTATCKQAFFYNDTHKIVLKGDVVVFEGNDKLTGDTVTYYLDEDRTYVEGQPDKRAHVTITPK
jgi:outer membrane protein assembly factor BamD